MALVKVKPTSPGRRAVVQVVNAHLHKGKPFAALVESQSKNAGRNMYGRITVRHRGGGHKRQYRLIDFKRDKHGIPAKVAAIEYDPNRSSRIALLNYKDGEKRYILATANMKVGDVLFSGANVEPTEGNSLPLSHIPLGVPVHNIELVPGMGGRLVRGAGMAAEIMAREGDYAHVKLPSGEIRMINVKCSATVGQLGNLDHQNIIMGKAGRKRWMGIRPTVRGVAMNPIDHVMGGGEGRSSGGGHPRSPWGKPTKGKKTRNRRKSSKNFIIQRRK